MHFWLNIPIAGGLNSESRPHKLLGLQQRHIIVSNHIRCLQRWPQISVLFENLATPEPGATAHAQSKQTSSARLKPTPKPIKRLLA